MRDDRNRILEILDACCEALTFPMLDNGYVYPAATRLSLFRSPADWALVIEIFGFSPRIGVPDTTIYTFASQIANRTPESKWVDRVAYHNYMRNNPNNEFHAVWPVAEGDWQHSEDCELISEKASELILRDTRIEIPNLSEYQDAGVELIDPPSIHIFELCRALAYKFRNLVLATPEERRFNAPPSSQLLLMLDEWTHPDLLNDELPSRSPTFQKLADVLVSGDPEDYVPITPPNTHWGNWPLGGTL